MAKDDKKPTHVAAIEFRDKDDFSKVYGVGDDVSHFDAARLETLVANGHVTAVATEPAK